MMTHTTEIDPRDADCFERLQQASRRELERFIIAVESDDRLPDAVKERLVAGAASILETMNPYHHPPANGELPEYSSAPTSG